MAGRSTLAPSISVPDNEKEQLSLVEQINLSLRIIKVRIEKEHPIFQAKFAQILANTRARHGKTMSVSIKNTLIGMLDVIYDDFDDTKKRDEYIHAVNKFLKVLSKYHAENGYAKSARHAFIYYFHKLIRKRETLPTDFLVWFQNYIGEWQNKNLFGVEFDFARWKKEKTADLLKAHRNLNVYPKKNWHYNEGLFNFNRRESSEEDLAPVTDDADETNAEFAIGNIYNDPALLLYFLVEYNVFHLSELQYHQVLNVIKQGEGQVALLGNLLDQVSVLSKPIIRIMQNNSEEHEKPNSLTLAILKKLREESVPLCVLSSNQAAFPNVMRQERRSRAKVVDPDGRSRFIIYSNKLPKLEKMPEEVTDASGIKYRASYVYASSSDPVLDNLKEHVTNLFAPHADKKADGLESYVVHRIIQPEVHHFELLKITSIRLLEEYLTKTNVAVDRLKSAMCLLKNINGLATKPDAFGELNKLLLDAKDRAQKKDEKVNAGRFRLFHRNCFGSRYITLLDDLLERSAMCQPPKAPSKTLSL